MNIAIVGPAKGYFEQNIDKIGELFTEDTVETWFLSDKDAPAPLMPQLTKAKPDLLITEDLMRFEECTLTDSIVYNLLHCRQLHFLLSDRIKNEALLEKQLSLVMYFYCNSDEKKKYYEEKYPDIPSIENVGEDIAGAIAAFLKK